MIRKLRCEYEKWVKGTENKPLKGTEADGKSCDLRNRCVITCAGFKYFGYQL